METPQAIYFGEQEVLCERYAWVNETTFGPQQVYTLTIAPCQCYASMNSTKFWLNISRGRPACGVVTVCSHAPIELAVYSSYGFDYCLLSEPGTGQRSPLRATLYSRQSQQHKSSCTESSCTGSACTSSRNGHVRVAEFECV